MIWGAIFTERESIYCFMVVVSEGVRGGERGGTDCYLDGKFFDGKTGKV